MLYFILINIIFGSLKIHREFGVVRQCLIFRVVFVQIEIVVVRYMGIRFNSGYISSRPGLPSGIEVQLRLCEPGVRARAIPRA